MKTLELACKLVLGRSIGIDKTNTVQLQFLFSIKNVGATRRGTNWWYARICKICLPSPNFVALSFRDLGVHTDGRVSGIKTII